MTCETCGDKPKKDRHFPSAVVEINNPESLVLLRKVVISASLGDDTAVPPAVGKYRNVILQYEANGHLYLYSSDGIPTAIESNAPQEVLDRITELESDVSTLDRDLDAESDARERADGVLQQEIDDLKNSPDVVDIVPTYAALMAYDTSSLGDKDVIRVLADETHEGQSDYYRWSTTTETWTFIGTVGDYYTKTQIDSLLDGKQDELTPGENVSIVDESGALVISAQDTTYTAGTGIAINNGVISATSSGPTVVQTTGTSQTDVMSQNAVTSMVYADPTNRQQIRLGDGASTSTMSVALGRQANGSSDRGVAIGAYSSATYNGSVALGSYSVTSVVGEVNIGSAATNYGYNSSNYRLLTGLYDGQSAHDAVTKGQMDVELSYKQDELTAGTGISIADESGALVISATGASIATINAQDWSALWQ